MHMTSRLGTLACVLLLLLTTACGAGGDDTTSTDDTAPADDTTAEDTPAADDTDDGDDAEEGTELPTLRYLQASASLAYLPVYVAMGLGYFEEEGVALEDLTGAGNLTAGVQLLLDDQVDIVATGTASIYNAAAEGRDVRSVSIITPNPSQLVVLTNEAVEQLAADGITPDSPIEDRVAGMAGLTIAAPAAGSSTDIQLRRTLQEYGVQPDTDLTLQPIQDPTAAVASAREGQADGYIFSPPTGAIGAVEGWGQVWISFPAGDVPAYQGVYVVDAAVAGDLLADQPDAVAAFVAAVDRGFATLSEDPESARAAVREFFPDMEQDLFDTSFDAILPAFADGGTPSEEGFDRTLTALSEGAEEPIDVTYDAVYGR